MITWYNIAGVFLTLLPIMVMIVPGIMYIYVDSKIKEERRQRQQEELDERRARFEMNGKYGSCYQKNVTKQPNKYGKNY